MNALENRPVDNQSIFNSARNKALHLLQRAAQTTEPISEGHTDAPEPSDDAADTKQQTDGDSDELSIFDLWGMKSMTGLRPKSISFPDGTEESINDWRRLYVTVADWLIDNGRLSQQNIPNKVQSHFSDEQVQFDSGAFKSRKLKNGMWLNTNFSASQTMARISQLLEAYGENPAQFQVQLR